MDVKNEVCCCVVVDVCVKVEFYVDVVGVLLGKIIELLDGVIFLL